MSNGVSFFKKLFSKQKHFSVIFAGILILASFVSHFAVKIVNERKAKQLAETGAPKMMIDEWKKDLLAFHAKFAHFPANLRELEIQIWNRGDEKAASKLSNGESVYTFDNVVYIYNGGGQACSFWAIAIGEQRRDTNTVYMLLTSKDNNIWKGASLSPDDILAVPHKVVPTVEEMARLGMNKQLADSKDSPSQNKPSFFPSFGKR